jgi:hypothetical protein
MYGLVFRVAAMAPVAYLLWLLINPFFQVAAELIAAGPAGPTGLAYMSVKTVSEVFLFLLILSLLMQFLGGAAAEGRLKGRR